jgi:hypothetical protein
LTAAIGVLYEAYGEYLAGFTAATGELYEAAGAAAVTGAVAAGATELLGPHFFP